MKKEAVLHIPLSNYAHGTDEKHLVFRIRAARDDLQSCTICYGDRACRVNPVIFTEVPMKCVAQDELYDYYEADVESLYTRICYYFVLDDGVEKTLYYADKFTNSHVEDRSEYYQLPFNHRENIAIIPEWTKNAVIYNIFPDSFATGERYISKKPVSAIWEDNTVTHGLNGGTITGIKDNLNYLQELGITCIYTNPIFVAGEYHKYDLLDYFHIDPCFGTDEDFKELVNACHERGMKIIVDGVFNHCSWNFFAFDDVVRNGEESKYVKWFYGLQFPVIRPDNMADIPNYECFAYERKMPKLNTSNPEVMDYFLHVCRYWIEEFHIDGWRLDVASEVDFNFWREFRKAAKAANPDCFIIGEVWEPAQAWLQGDQFDSTMNYDFRNVCRDFFAFDKLDAYEFDGCVTGMRMRYKKNITGGQLNLLDSHDTSRFLSLCKEDIKRMKLAVLFQMTFIGVPSVFYGDELQLSGKNEDEYRQPMDWNFSKDNEMLQFYQAAIKLRKELLPLTEGDFVTIKAGKNSKVYAFSRSSKDDRIIVALNASEQQQDIREINVYNMPVLLSDGLEEGILKPWGYVVYGNC